MRASDLEGLHAGEGAAVVEADVDVVPVIAGAPDDLHPPPAVAEVVAAARLRELGFRDVPMNTVDSPELQQAAGDLALISFADIAVFFLVLMVGFAYVWKRGDLDWVRAVTRDRPQPLHRAPPRAIEPSQSILSA